MTPSVADLPEFTAILAFHLPNPLLHLLCFYPCLIRLWWVGTMTFFAFQDFSVEAEV